MSWYISGNVTSSEVLGAYQAYGAASQAASYVNLNNSGTNDLTVPSVAPGWTSTGGWSFTAATKQYLSTGALALTHEVSAIFAYTDALYTLKTAFGYQDAGLTKFYATFSDIGGNKLGVGFADQTATYSTSLTSGIVAITSAGIYMNGNLVAAMSGSATSYSDGESLFIGAMSVIGTPSLYFTGKIQAIAFYNRTLTAGEVSDLTSKVSLLLWAPTGTGARASGISSVKETSKAATRRIIIGDD